MRRLYSHERGDSPHFSWVQQSLAETLATVRHSQGPMEALGFNLREEANLQSLTINVLKTSEIEGEKLNAEMVSSSIARRLGLDIGTLQPADRNVEGIVETTLDATGNSASRSPARGSLPGLPPFSQPGLSGTEQSQSHVLAPR